jgi:hypothetical protein
MQNQLLGAFRTMLITEDLMSIYLSKKEKMSLESLADRYDVAFSLDPA